MGIYSKSEDDVVNQTKQGVSNTFANEGLVVPQNLQTAEYSKTDLKLAHTVVDHLYLHVLLELRTALDELQDLSGKKYAQDDSRVSDAIYSVTTAVTVITTVINNVSIPGVPETVEELDALIEKLQEEVKLANELAQLESSLEGAPVQ